MCNNLDLSIYRNVVVPCVSGLAGQNVVSLVMLKIKMILTFLFSAHLSRRLIGELIVYPWSGIVRPSSFVHNAQTSSQKPLG